MRNTTFISSVVLSVACVSAANAGVVDPFTVGSTVTDPDGIAVETSITGGLWDSRATSVLVNPTKTSASIDVNATTNALTFAVTRLVANTQSQQAEINYNNVAAAANNLSNFTSLTFDYSSTFASLLLYIDLGGKIVTKTLTSSAGSTFTLNANELGGAFTGDYLILQFNRYNSNANGTFTMTNLVANGIPAPGAIALLGAAGLIGGRRRRA